MKYLVLLLIFGGLLSLNQVMFAQTLSGAESYSTEYDDYLDDFIEHKGKAYQLIEQKIFTYPETVYALMLHGLDITVNPLYLGNEYSSLKFIMDKDENVYLTGIYTQKILNDTSFLFISKLDKKGKNVWSKLFEKKSDLINIFSDESDYLYIHDSQFLYKLSPSGNLIWVKVHKGNIIFFNNYFYKIEAKNIHNSISFYVNHPICDSVLFEKIDTSGNQVYQKVINRGVSTSTMISTSFSFNIVDNRIFICNSFWGTININPSESKDTFENTVTYWNGKWGYIPCFNNYLAVYDTLGNLELANSKIYFPRLEYACTDSAGSLYFAGCLRLKNDFNFNSDDSNMITATISDKSFIAKYSNNLDFLWIRKLSGNIKYIGTSYYLLGGVEKLDIAGEFNGTINLDFKRASDVTFTSDKQDLFYAKYIHLNENLSPTSILVNNIDNSFLIFPNPNSGIFKIKFNNKSSNKISLEIYSLLGEKIIEKPDFNLQYSNEIDISAYPKGIYLVKISDGEKMYIERIIIQ